MTEFKTSMNELPERTRHRIKMINVACLVTLAVSLLAYPAALVFANIYAPETITGSWFMKFDPLSDQFQMVTITGLTASIVIRAVAVETKWRANKLNSPNVTQRDLDSTSYIRITLWAMGIFISMPLSLILTAIMNGMFR